MKVIYKNYKVGELKLKIESADDLWSLTYIIGPKDLVRGRTFRKIKLGEAEAKTKVVKKPVSLTIEVEKIEFDTSAASLRVSGVVKEGPEDVPRGSHHTLDVEQGTVLKITKQHWYKYQVDRVEESAKEKPVGVLVCVLDRGEAGFALLKKYGYEWLGEFEGSVAKKGFDEKKEPTFYADVARNIYDYAKRYGIEHIIIGSPAFWKEDLFKVLKKKYPDLASKVTLATCSESGKEGVNEVLKRDEVKTVLQQQRVAKEMKLVEELLAQISKQGKAAYGIKEVKTVAEIGAVATLLVTDGLIMKLRLQGKFEELDNVMKSVDKAKGAIVIVSSGHDGGKKLDGLGGIGALLRYKMNY